MYKQILYIECTSVWFIVFIPDDDNLETFYKKFAKKLGASHGELDHAKIESLLSLAPKLDDKCSKKAYQDVQVSFMMILVLWIRNLSTNSIDATYVSWNNYIISIN